MKGAFLFSVDLLLRANGAISLFVPEEFVQVIKRRSNWKNTGGPCRCQLPSFYLLTV